MDAIRAWEKVVERFELCGGTVTEADKKTVLLKLLPAGVSTDLVGALRGKPSYDEMKNELDDRIDFLQDHGFVRPSKSSEGAHMVQRDGDNGEEDEQQEQGDEEKEIVLDPNLPDEVFAVMANQAKHFGYRVAPRAKAKAWARPSGGRVPTPPRTGDSRPAKCGNCGGEHSTRDCTKPMLPPDKRACFNCGKTGHQARGCPEKKAAR